MLSSGNLRLSMVFLTLLMGFFQFSGSAQALSEHYSDTMRQSAISSSLPDLEDCLVFGTTGIAFGGNRLQILDLTDPDNPLALSHLFLSSGINDIAQGDGLVVAGLNSGELVLVDIEPASEIHLLDSLNLGQPCFSVLKLENLVLAGTSGGDFRTVGISGDVVLAPLGLTSTPSDAVALADIGSIALVSSDHGLTSVDFSDPANPVTLGTWSEGIPGNSWPTESPTFGRISVSGNQAAILCRQ